MVMSQERVDLGMANVKCRMWNVEGAMCDGGRSALGAGYFHENPPYLRDLAKRNVSAANNHAAR